MKTPCKALHGMTLIEILVVITIIASIAALAFPGINAALVRGRMTEQLANGRSIYQGMANYASDPNKDEFPTFANVDDPATAATTSNEAFDILLQGRFLDDKRVFGNRNSAWTRRVVNSEATEKKVMPGENDWCYVAGIRWTTKDSKWPILANAFSPGTTTYVEDASKKGGVWKGTRAVVVYAGGNGEVVDTVNRGGSYFIKRVNKPAANAFEQDGEWLAGDNVKVLHPAD